MWNLTDINTLSKEHQMLEQYTKHQKVMKKIGTQKGCVYSDDTEPIRPTFLQGESRSRKIKMNRDMEIEIENRNLFNKMQDITTKPGNLNPILLKNQLYKKGSLNLDHRVQTMKNIMTQNSFMEGRLQTMKGSISNNKLSKEFKVNDSYLKSISKHSRRIVNCFLSTDKKKKYASTSQLTKTVQKMNTQGPRQEEIDYEQEAVQMEQEQQQQDQEQSKEGFFLTGAQS